MSLPSMIFDSTWLGQTTYGVMVEKTVMPVMAQPKTNTVNFAQKDGGFNQGGTRNMLSLPISILIQGDDYDDLKVKIDALTFLLDPSNGDKTIRVDNRLDRQWTGSLSSPIMEVPAGASTYRTTLVFSVQPHAEAVIETSQTVATDADPKNFTIPASGVVGGSMPALPVYTYTNGSTTSLSFTLTNNTTGVVCTVDNALVEDEILRWDSERQIVEVSTDLGVSFSSVMDDLSLTEKTFPTLAPQVSNSFTLSNTQTAVDGTLVITYRERY